MFSKPITRNFQIWFQLFLQNTFDIERCIISWVDLELFYRDTMKYLLENFNYVNIVNWSDAILLHCWTHRVIFCLKGMSGVILSYGNSKLNSRGSYTYFHKPVYGFVKYIMRMHYIIKSFVFFFVKNGRSIYMIPHNLEGFDYMFRECLAYLSFLSRLMPKNWK